MKTKKLISILMAMSLILALGAFALADNGISGENQITVSYNTAQYFEVIIPSGSPAIGASTPLTVSAINVLLPEGKELNVNFASENNFALSLTAGEVTSTIPYSVSLNGNTVANGAKILTVVSGETSGEATLIAAVGDSSSVTLAGTHTDTLSFICEVTDIAAAEDNNAGSSVDTQETSGDDSTSGGDSSVQNKLITQNPTLGGDVVGQAGEAGGYVGGGSQETGPYGDNPRPEPEPEPEPVPHSDPYPWQKY